MSRTRTYGKVIAIQTGGRGAVQKHERTKAERDLGRRLSTHFSQLLRILTFAGVVLDPESYETTFDRTPDQDLYGYKVTGRQTRNVFKRIIWAIKL